MIKINNEIYEIGPLLGKYPPESAESKILNKLYISKEIFRYSTESQLNFELKLRKNIIDASIELYRSRMGFETFSDSRCNTDYWQRTAEGGFKLKNGVKPSEAILDIFRNGRKYGIECATAIVIVFYGALLKVFLEEPFNTLFPNIYLMNWIRMDPAIGIQFYRDVEEGIPGDCRYFKNPDVDPETPEWQGENTIVLSDDNYYGHGIGIRPEDWIIEALNEKRIPEAQTSSFLTHLATRPDFISLAKKHSTYM